MGRSLAAVVAASRIGYRLPRSQSARCARRWRVQCSTVDRRCALTEVVAEYEQPVNASDGSTWAARACARPSGEKWEGWIEFVPLSAGRQPLRTPRETTQPDRAAIVDWAEGIRPTYLEGALERALDPLTVVEPGSSPPLFDRPAPTLRAGELIADRPQPILDPFAVYAQGEQVLVDQLAALGTEHLRNIVSAYELATPETVAQASRAQLTSHILAAVRHRR